MRFLFNRTSQTMIDLVVLSVALWSAHFLRFDGHPPTEYSQRLLLLWPYVVGLQYGSLMLMGVHRYQWRYVGLREATRILAALAVAALVLLIVRFAVDRVDAQVPVLGNLLLPLGINLIDWVLAFLGITGVRVVRRLLAERADERKHAHGLAMAESIVLIGAGQGGLMVAKELASRPDLGLRPVGFVDDDPRKLGTDLHGLRVLGATHDLVRICLERGIRQALITISSAPGKDIRRIAELCRQNDIAAKIVPGIYEIVGGKVNLSRIRDVQIEDLLGRAPIELNVNALSSQLGGKVVLVTGAGGWIGSELCRQVAQFKPHKLILLDHAENAVYDIHRELVAQTPDVLLKPIVADICDLPRIRSVMSRFQPEVVFHAAAHKHVPMMEENPDQAVKNNLFGTQLLADEADRAGVGSFVMISTDKAVNPTSVMGATKRAAEIYAQTLARQSKTRFVTVRFGNVLGSAGSVIPLFREQIARGGPVTVTHPDMKRYFMTIPEACQLVMEAGTLGQGGEIFILDMGEPVKIVDLARDMIELSGFVPGEDIEIEFSGVRPGEKLFEELSVDGESASKTRNPKIFIGRARDFGEAEVTSWLLELRAICERGAADDVRLALTKLIPEYSPDFGHAKHVPPVTRRLIESAAKPGLRVPALGAPSAQPGFRNDSAESKTN